MTPVPQSAGSGRGGLDDRDDVLCGYACREHQLPVVRSACSRCERTGPQIRAERSRCWQTFGQVQADEALRFGYPPAHRLVVDAYMAQHPGNGSDRRDRQPVFATSQGYVRYLS